MSRIKRLKLKGFKSFANPTVLNFEEGFNTIVGANGSGKSNVFDAMCFVLGRMSSKGLRADKLGNLVFNGGKTTKPAKEASVDIFLSNEERELMDVELDEIKISRVVKSKGTSTYYLNNNKATRTEIVEVLRRASIDPDGYNIILQGDIMKIVNMTPNERRELIEEIANISNYESKRQTSLKKLDVVDIDLKDADLLLTEKTKYIRDLKSEKEAAVKFHKTKDDLRFNSLLLIKAKLIRNSLLKKKKQETVDSREIDLKEFRDKLDEFELQEKQIDDKISELERSIEIASHNNFIEVTNKITAKESDIVNLKEKRADLKKQIVELKSKNLGVLENVKKNKGQIKEIEKVLISLDKNKKTVEKELVVVEDKVLGIKKNISSDSFKELDEVDKIVDELNKKKYSKNQIRQDNALQIERLNAKIEHWESDLMKIESSAVENKGQVDELNKNRKRLKEIIISISKISSENSSTAAKLNSLRQEYSGLVDEHSVLKMKVASSANLMATNRAVDAILKLKSKDSSILGSVAELASVSSKYSMALETVAGKSLFNVVVDNDSCAVKYINLLKEKRIGSCTFLPLNKIRTKFRLDDSVLNKKGVIDYALNLVQYDPKYENIFHLIFQNTVVIDKIESAKGVGIGDYKMITLSGDIVTKSGAMSGGFRKRSRGLGAFKDDKSSNRLEELNMKIINLKNTIDHLDELKEESEGEIYDLRQERVNIDGDIAKFEKLLSVEGRDVDSIKVEIANIEGDKTIILGSLKKIDRDINDIEVEIKEAVSKKNLLKASSGEQSAVIDSMSKFEDERDILKEKIRSISSSIDAKMIQVKNVLNPEIINLNKMLEDTKQASDYMKEQVDEISKKLGDLEIEVKGLKKEEKELSKDYKDFIALRDKLKENRKKIEIRYDKQYDKYSKVKENIAALNYAISEFDKLNVTLTNDLEFFYSELKTEFVEGEHNDIEEGEKKIEELLAHVDERLTRTHIDIKELQSRVNNLKTKLNSFGSINMKAVEIYDKLNEEFKALIEKRQGLTAEKNEILILIEEMDIKKKEKFLITFADLQKNFERIFSTLSTKGEIELNMENEDDIFNSGVEIRVRLTRKNYLDIKSLSGGEKTITAIAFIFAVQEFSPASFYIFDEVDAALDIMNAEKLGKLVKSYSSSAQYVVVSHSEHLIQSSDTIYGVTMNHAKISDVVTLDLRDMADYLDDE